MSTADKTAANQTDTVSFELDLRHAPAKVWRALTDAKLLSEWLLPVVDLQLHPGATFAFKADPQPGWDGVVACKCLEVEPQKTLRYAWTVGDLDTVVTFTLSPTKMGSHLSIVQSGFKPGQKQNWGGARYGWNLMTGKLVALLDRTSETPSSLTKEQS